jgi:phospholipase/carboxylesterase
MLAPVMKLADLPHVLRPADGTAAGAIVLLHGPGAGEQDPMGLVEVLDPAKRLIAASPQGTMDVRGAVGYQWFVDREPGYPQRDTFEQTLEILNDWLTAFSAETGVPRGRTILGGMSQGATMAWALAVGKGKPRPAGLMAISGYIPRVTDFETDDAKLKGMPIIICHGANDPKVPVSLAQSARDRATEAGAHVVYKESDVPHILDPRVVPDLIAWVNGFR